MTTSKKYPEIAAIARRAILLAAKNESVGISKQDKERMIEALLFIINNVLVSRYRSLINHSFVEDKGNAAIMKQVGIERFEDFFNNVKITEENYFLSSKGDFSAISEEDARLFIDAYLGWRKKGRKTPLELIVNGKRYSFNYESISHRYYTSSYSIYFVSEDKKELLRISDHWSKSVRYKDYSKFNVGNIASCYWTNEDAVSLHAKMPGEKKTTAFLGGKIQFSKLKNIGYHLYPFGVSLFDKRYNAQHFIIDSGRLNKNLKIKHLIATQAFKPEWFGLKTTETALMGMNLLEFYKVLKNK